VRFQRGQPGSPVQHVGLCGADLTGARTAGTRMEDADLRGATVDSSVWTTASRPGARIDIAQALAYAAAHGLRLDGARDQ
jgi:uncharacterized protein YjbI with pentapeptide repeats